VDRVGNAETLKNIPEITVRVKSDPMLNILSVNNKGLCSGDSLRMVWTASEINSVNIAYSTDGGVHYTPLVTNLPDSLHYYAFQVPGSNQLQNLLIHITDAAVPSSKEDTISAIVHPRPVVTASPASATICAGSPLQLSASGVAGSYYWTPSYAVVRPDTNIVQVTPTQNTHFVVTARDLNGCTATDSVNVTVHQVDSIFVQGVACSLADTGVFRQVLQSQFGCDSIVVTTRVLDVLPPVVITKDIQVQLNANGLATITPNDVNDGTIDNCTIVSLLINRTTFTCADTGKQIVWLTAIDQLGNRDSSAAFITVLRPLAPSISCPDTITVNAPTNACSTPVNYPAATTTDNCGATIHYSQNPGAVFPVGETIVTATATDAAGHTATCKLVIAVQDITPPQAICQNRTVLLDASGNASVTAAMVNNGSTDACGIASATLSQTDFTCTDVGPNILTLVVTDNSGNVSTCTTTITVKDATPPTAHCQNQIVVLDNTGNGSITAAQVDNGSFDICGVKDRTLSQTAFTCVNTGPNNLTLTVTDNNGNTATCQAVITVQDLMPPQANCRNITVPLDASGNAVITAAQVDNGSEDECVLHDLYVSPSMFTCTNTGSNNVILTVTDVNGNSTSCTAVVTVVDQTPPTARCRNLTVQLNPGGNVAIDESQVDNGSYDGCGVSNLILDIHGLNCSNTGTNMLTLTVTDNHGNTATCTSVITVQDLVPPTAQCQNAVIQLDADGHASLDAALINNGSSDACPIQSISASPNLFTCANVGDKVVTLTVQDVNNNVSTCQATVTVQDLIPPVARCKATYTIALDASGNGSVSAAQLDSGSSDVCGIATKSLSQSAFTCADIGLNQIVMTITDVNGNHADCTTTVSVEDHVHPIALCRNFTVQVDASGSVDITADQVNDGCFDACGLTSITIDQTTFNCTKLGANTLTLTATDYNGNTSTCTAIVTVQDTIAPLASCKNVTVQLNSAGVATLLPAQVNNGSSDNCSVASVLFQSAEANSATFNCGNIGVNTVTLLVTDGSGNKDVCQATVTVEDKVAPTAHCKNATVQLNTNGNIALNAAQIDNASADACGILSLTISPDAFDCTNIGVANFVTLTVTDQNGNSATCTATVTVQDVTAPTARCQNAVVYLDATGLGAVTAALINNNSSDACVLAALSVNVAQYTCNELGDNILTLTATDNSGNAATCQATVTVLDTIPPAANCKMATVVLDASGNGSISPAQVDNMSTDACTIVSTTVYPNVFSCADSGAKIVTFTATDNSGNVATCIANIMIYDGAAPVVHCQNAVVELDGSGQVTVTADQIDHNSADACGITSRSLTPSMFNCTNLGDNVVVFTATDGHGNSNTCSAVVTITDQQSPTVNCPATVIAHTDLNKCYATNVNLGAPVVTDNCTATTASNAPVQYVKGNTTIVWTATDGSGNLATCTQTVSVIDNQAPNIYCPQNMSFTTTAGACTKIVSYAVEYADNCEASVVYSPVSGYAFPAGTTLVTATASDASGNTASCTFSITVTDNEAPSITCQDITVELDALGAASVTAGQLNTSSDNCGAPAVVITSGKTNYTCDDRNLTYNLTLTATDVHGLTATCVAHVTVHDSQFPCNRPPAVYCQNITVNANDGCAAQVTAAQVDAGSTDPEGDPLTYSLAPASPYPVGTTSVVFTATDSGGATATCTATITVQDKTAPVINCPQNMSVNATAGQCGVTVTFPPATKSDNCGTPMVTYSQNPGSFFPVGTTTVIAMATDAANNSAVCYFDVMVADHEAPVISCPSSLTLNTSPGLCTASATYAATATDNCSVSSITYSHAPGSSLPVGTTPVIATATDASGNIASCNFSVTVEDHQPPVANCKGATVQLTAAGTVLLSAAQIDNASWDACGIDHITVNPVQLSCINVGTTIATLTVTDNSGNTASCTANVTVQDVTPPVALCKNATIQLDNNGNGTVLPALIDNGSTDVCGNVNLSVSPAAFHCIDVGTHTTVLTVTDLHGNTATCSATVTIQDKQAPLAKCKNSTVELDATGHATITAADVDNGSSDACGVATMSLSPNAFTCLTLGPRTVTLKVTDNNNNVSSCTATVTIQDNVLTSALCKNATVQLNAAGSVTITAALINAGSGDACGIKSLSVSPGTLYCSNVGPNNVSLIVTDKSGNVSTCNAVVTVQDQIAPVAKCRNAIVYLNGDGNGVLLASQVNNGSTDACGVNLLSVAPSTFNCSNTGANAVVLTVTDVNGNASTCSSTVYVKDKVAPTALCQNVVVQLNSAGQYHISAADIDNGSKDACGVAGMTVSPADLNCTDVGDNIIKLTVTDSHSNTATCTSTVTVQDHVAPQALCKDITVQLNAAGNGTTTAAMINNGSTDACGVKTLSASQTDFTCGDLGANDVTLTVTDKNGNTATCHAIVTVEDHVAPVALCKNVIVQLSAAGDASITAAQINNGSHDACGVQTLDINLSSFNCSNVGANPVVLTVTDVNGNSKTCGATVYVQDLVAPMALCRNITVQLDTAGKVTIAAAQVDNNSVDACGVQSMVVVPNIFNCSDVGVNTVTLKVKDLSNNIGSCTAEVTVLDTVPPRARCSSNVTVNLNASGNATLTVAEVDNGSADACGIQNKSISIGSFTCANLGSNVVTLTVTDKNGNTSTCTTIVSVKDAVAPKPHCKPATVYLNAAGTASVTVVQVNNGSTDNCLISTMALTPNVFNCAQTGTHIVTMKVTDNSGNTATCTTTVKVVDNIPPTALCKDITVNIPDLSGNSDDPNCPNDVIDPSALVTILSAQINNGSTDNCGVKSLCVSPSSLDCSNLGSNLITLTVKDSSGNASTCTATVTVTGPDDDCDGVPNACDFCPGGNDMVDNNHDGKPDCAFLPSYAQIIADWKCGTNKVYVCHRLTPGADPTVTLCVTHASAATHMTQGDYLGPCGNATCVGNKSSNNGMTINNQGTEIQNRSDENQQDLADFTLFPNPTDLEVFIGLDGFVNKRVELLMFDKLGKQVWRKEIPDAQDDLVEVQLKEIGLKAGVYTVVLHSAEKTIAKRLVLIE
jgi:hypothetical protein